ncbi:MFS transporter [Romeria aff. gracilis LEGE 07310]|uniref:MFS transporter n=1 Tax=Vasconcelosia minhoensis LEGE 07310 TaxID=915328 RepID=A0A8J7DQA7_9CYAN|nr:MFS transporter [Romeria aff. gracilis LEGE 07310]
MLVLLLAGGLSSAVGSVVAPVFPDVIEQFNVDPRWAGLLVSTHTLTMALASPLLGIWANRVGSLRILVPSLVAYALVGAAGALSQGFISMLLTRALVGVASGGIAAGSIGLLSQLYTGEARSRIMGYATSALATATIIFSLLGGWIGLYDWRYTFGLYGLSLPVALAALWTLPRRGQKSADLPQTQGLAKRVRQPDIYPLFLALAAVSAIFYVVVVYAPLYLKAAIGASSLFNGIVLAARSLGAALISALGASRLAKTVGVNGAIAIGFLCMALSLVAIPNLVHEPLILLSALLFGIGFGLVMPNFYSALADRSPEAQRAGIVAIGTGAASLGQFLSPLLFGPVWKAAGGGVFYGAAGLAILVGILNWLKQRR